MDLRRNRKPKCTSTYHKIKLLVYILTSRENRIRQHNPSLDGFTADPAKHIKKIRLMLQKLLYQTKTGELESKIF